MHRNIEHSAFNLVIGRCSSWMIRHRRHWKNVSIRIVRCETIPMPSMIGWSMAFVSIRFDSHRSFPFFISLSIRWLVTRLLRWHSDFSGSVGRVSRPLFHREQSWIVRQRSSINLGQRFGRQWTSISNEDGWIESLCVSLVEWKRSSSWMSRVFYRSYSFAKQMIKTFNPTLLKTPVFNTLDIAIPVLTPLVNFDQLLSLIAGIPRGTLDNIIDNVHQINNFLTTPAVSKVSEEFERPSGLEHSMFRSFVSRRHRLVPISAWPRRNLESRLVMSTGQRCFK